VLETVHFALIIVLWVMCPFLIGLILLQGGAGDMSSAFGGGGALDSTLGVGAGRKMSKLTGWLSVVFLTMVAVVGIPHGSVAGRAAKVAPSPTTETKKPVETTGAQVPSSVGAPAAASVAVPAATSTDAGAQLAPAVDVPAAPAPAAGSPTAPALGVDPAAVDLMAPPAAAAPAPAAPKSALTVE